jgi:ribonuclease HI
MENQTSCKNCGYTLITKATKKSAGQLRKPYYYTAYYYCVRCKKLYHDDKFKVVNTPLFEESAMDSRLLLAGRQGRGNDNNNTLETLGTQTKYDAEIWTDGACVHNGTPLARAAWAFVSGKTEQAGRVVGKQTNNIAEALAIYHGLSWAAEKGFKRIKIYSDSQISLNNMKKPPNKILANREIFEQIAAVITANNLQVDYVKVLGHSGDINNERADRLANGLATNHR